MLTKLRLPRSQMIKIFQFLLHGCWHDWRLQGEGAATLKGERVGSYFRYQCSRCERIEDRLDC